MNGLNEFRKQKEIAMSKKDDKADDEMGLMEDDAKMDWVKNDQTSRDA